tara:strand:- start:61 stop:699 length:639 start_codon:yes stop_codon:yes gene_type:complete
MANKFLHYRKNPAAGGIYTEGGAVLKDVSGVVGIYDTAAEVPQNMDNDWETFVTVEYDWDPTVDSIHNLVLNAAGTGFDKKWSGKTVAEQLQAHHDEQKVLKFKEKKAQLKKQINNKASTLIERLEGWKLQKAEQQDFLSGGTDKRTAVYQEIENIRAASNVKQAELSPHDPTTLVGQNALNVFDPHGWGEDINSDPAPASTEGQWLDTPTA